MRRVLPLLAAVLVGGCTEATPLAMEEVSQPIAPAPEVIGTLERASFVSHKGCADADGTRHTWLVVRIAGGRAVPVKLGSSDDVARARADASRHPGPYPTAAADLDRPFLTPTEAWKRGLSVGDRVHVHGVVAPVLFSGSVAMAPVYGVLASDVARAR